MLSRSANNIYWLARYIERAENTARLINVNTHLLLDLPSRIRPGWEPIIDITGSKTAFLEHYQDLDERSAVRFMIASPHNPNSVLNSLSAARENVRTSRDFIPHEAWEQINQLYMWVKEGNQKAFSHRTRYDYLQHVILGVQAITGLLAGTMTQDEGYDFLRMGRNLERADMTTRIIDVRSATLLPDMDEDLTPFENIQWMSVLKSLTGYQMYRRVMRSRVSRPDVLRFLFLERRFPRAFYHAICQVETCLEHLPRNERPIKPLLKLKRRMMKAKPENLEQDDLHRFIDGLQRGLIRLNDEITATYF